MSRPPLAVWLYGTHVARLSETSNGRLALEWTDEAHDRWGVGSRVMSHLLPMRSKNPVPPQVKAFLDGLLPEGNLRTNYALDIGVDPDDTFALVSYYGRDTAGALVFAALGEAAPDRAGTYEPMTTHQTGELLQSATRNAPAAPGGFQSTSLAGMHPKIAVHRVGQQWLRCRGGAPSTWILKLGPSEGAAADVLDTEVLCNELARGVGLAKTRSELVQLGTVRAIAVERYDRLTMPDGSIVRVHQEDLAQALGINTADPDRKFQRGRDLPSLRQAAGVLAAGGADARPLLALATFSHLVGNTDMHAKNISFMRWDDGTADLAPAYDISAHMHHGATPRISALYVNGKSRMDEIHIADLLEETQSWPGRLPERDRVMSNVISSLLLALDKVDRSDHPGVSDEAFATIRQRVTRAARALPAGPFDHVPASTARQPAAATAPPTVGKSARPRDVGEPSKRRGPRRPSH